MSRLSLLVADFIWEYCQATPPVRSPSTNQMHFIQASATSSICQEASVLDNFLLSRYPLSVLQSAQQVFKTPGKLPVLRDHSATTCIDFCRLLPVRISRQALFRQVVEPGIFLCPFCHVTARYPTTQHRPLQAPKPLLRAVIRRKDVIPAVALNQAARRSQWLARWNDPKH